VHANQVINEELNFKDFTPSAQQLDKNKNVASRCAKILLKNTNSKNTFCLLIQELNLHPVTAGTHILIFYTRYSFREKKLV
jgi:hypothetical protein